LFSLFSAKVLLRFQNDAPVSMSVNLRHDRIGQAYVAHKLFFFHNRI